MNFDDFFSGIEEVVVSKPNIRVIYELIINVFYFNAITHEDKHVFAVNLILEELPTNKTIIELVKQKNPTIGITLQNGHIFNIVDLEYLRNFRSTVPMHSIHYDTTLCSIKTKRQYYLGMQLIKRQHRDCEIDLEVGKKVPVTCECIFSYEDTYLRK